MDGTWAHDYDPHHHPLLLKAGAAALGVARLDDCRVGMGIVRRVVIVLERQRQGFGRRLDLN